MADSEEEVPSPELVAYREEVTKRAMAAGEAAYGPEGLIDIVTVDALILAAAAAVAQSGIDYGEGIRKFQRFLNTYLEAHPPSDG